MKQAMKQEYQNFLISKLVLLHTCFMIFVMWTHEAISQGSFSWSKGKTCKKLNK